MADSWENKSSRKKVRAKTAPKIGNRVEKFTSFRKSSFEKHGNNAKVFEYFVWEPGEGLFMEVLISFNWLFTCGLDECYVIYVISVEV